MKKQAVLKFISYSNDSGFSLKGEVYDVEENYYCTVGFFSFNRERVENELAFYRDGEFEFQLVRISKA